MIDERSAMNRFEYQERKSCICGELLNSSGNKIKKKFTWGDVSFVKCKICGSWCQSPQLSLRSLEKWFDSADYQGSDSKKGSAYINYLDDEGSRIEEARMRFKRDIMEKIPTGSKVLELGCATGSLLSIIREHGAEVYGIDLSPKFVAAARQLNNIDVKLGDLDSIDLPQHYFDSIMFFGTIGNFRTLNHYFEKFKKLLKEDGVLVFNFVDADSMIVRYLFRARFWMFTPSVNCFMTRKGCELILKNAGFRIIEIRNDVQRPSFQKLFNHAKLSFLVPFFRLLGIDKSPLPFSLPIPSVKLVYAKAD